MLIKDLPIEIQRLVWIRQIEANNKPTTNDGIYDDCDTFYWDDTDEGYEFWDNIDDGDFDCFYNKYGKGYKFNKHNLVVLGSHTLDWVDSNEIIRLGGAWWGHKNRTYVDQGKEIAAICASAKGGNGCGYPARVNLEPRHATFEEYVKYFKEGIGAKAILQPTQLRSPGLSSPDLSWGVKITNMTEFHLYREYCEANRVPFGPNWIGPKYDQYYGVSREGRPICSKFTDLFNVTFESLDKLFARTVKKSKLHAGDRVIVISAQSQASTKPDFGLVPEHGNFNSYKNVPGVIRRVGNGDNYLVELEDSRVKLIYHISNLKTNEVLREDQSEQGEPRREGLRISRRRVQGASAGRPIGREKTNFRSKAKAERGKTSGKRLFPDRRS